MICGWVRVEFRVWGWGVSVSLLLLLICRYLCLMLCRYLVSRGRLVVVLSRVRWWERRLFKLGFFVIVF